MRIENQYITEFNTYYDNAAEYDADIIILSMNRLNHTLTAIDSALRQKLIRTRILLLDQGSSSATISSLRRKVSGCRTVRLFETAKNLGVGGGRNFLSSIGQGRIIVALDNDALFDDEYVVRNTLNLFDAQPELGAIGFQLLSGEGNQTDELCWGYPSSLKSHCNERFLTTTFVGAGHAIRRTTWDQVGEYDKNLFFTWEEYDFCLRAIARQWDILYDGSLRVFHNRASEERVHWLKGRQRLFVRNRLLIARKWGHNWASLLPRIIGYTINGAINRQLRPTLAGILEAIREDKNKSKQKMSQHMRSYLQKNEEQHRGSFYRRIWLELLKTTNRKN